MKTDSLDKIIHEPARLVILAQLAPVESMDCAALMRGTGLTWGNLAAHLAKLERAGYLTLEKEFQGRKPHTTVRLGQAGRIALRRYLFQISELLDRLRG